MKMVWCKWIALLTRERWLSVQHGHRGRSEVFEQPTVSHELPTDHELVLLNAMGGCE